MRENGELVSPADAVSIARWLGRQLGHMDGDQADEFEKALYAVLVEGIPKEQAASRAVIERRVNRAKD